MKGMQDKFKSQLEQQLEIIKKKDEVAKQESDNIVEENKLETSKVDSYKI